MQNLNDDDKPKWLEVMLTVTLLALLVWVLWGLWVAWPMLTAGWA